MTRWGVLKLIEDSSSDVLNQAFKLDGVALLTEVGTALIMGVRRKEGSIGGENAKGEKAQEAGDFDQDLRALCIENFS